jgi:hypothetical protein
MSLHSTVKIEWDPGDVGACYTLGADFLSDITEIICSFCLHYDIFNY